jgi:hypothetical protein
MGLLTSLFRLLHPLNYAKRRVKRAIIPRPIRRAKWIAGGVVHPLSRTKYVVRRRVIRSVDRVISPKRKRPRASKQVLEQAYVEPGNGGLVAHLSDGTSLRSHDDIVRFVARHAGVPLERLHTFRQLVDQGATAEAKQIFSNEEGLRVAAAYQEANRQIRALSRRLPKPQ